VSYHVVTVYYRWHPLAGQKLIVHGRVNRNGERVLCHLPDGTVGSLPAWMLRAESSELALGKPLVSVDALRELRDLLSALQASIGCGKASLKILPEKEGNDETAEAKHTATASTVPATGPAGDFTGSQTKRSDKRTGGTPLASRRRKQRESIRKATKR
jgi:hypothetical protein